MPVSSKTGIAAAADAAAAAAAATGGLVVSIDVGLPPSSISLIEDATTSPAEHEERQFGHRSEQDLGKILFADKIFGSHPFKRRWWDPLVAVVVGVGPLAGRGGGTISRCKL
eukprot:CAMPEP_0178571988 /NCGR_PEP_ID=MMETSP0697-20121206/17969_1 /TAXON_ID=265572 /ORGANISM="Extubocellulus spinifer, Strain CCMP396" /LENGTH=111 /DNA_ID=CAMNT_0020206659 /DNA_START=87 /DNA_END=419 /DNA_ORIENTATION=-